MRITAERNDGAQRGSFLNLVATEEIATFA